MWSYRKRVERDLARWRDAGWVTEAGAAAISADVAKGGKSLGLAHALAILAAVLIGFAVMSFVASNWQDMSRLARLGLLTGALWTSYIGAGALFARGMESFGHAMSLLGASIFGASIMLVSQMYHMDGNPPDAVLVWALGALLAGVALRSNPTLALAMVLVGTWGWMEQIERETVYWPFFIGWGVVAAAFFWRGWRPGLHVAGLTLTAFVIGLGYILSRGHAHEMVALLGGLGIIAAFAGERWKPELGALWSTGLGYAIATAFAGLYAMQFFEDLFIGGYYGAGGLSRLVVLAVVTLVLVLGAIYWGLSAGHRGALWLGYIGFSLEVLGIYSKTMGTLLGTSLFFLIAGLIVAGLAFLAYRLHARQTPEEIAQ